MRITEWEMRSRAGAGTGAGDDGRTYRIRMAVPEGEAPRRGYPVLYVLDGNALFSTAADAVWIQSRRTAKTGVLPAVVVGIGYPGEEPFPEARHYDFTLPVPPEQLPAHPEGGSWPAQGGAADFLRFIEDELKPAIEARCPIDRSRQTLLGHSLGGLFVLHALFARPGSFGTYVAGSPSIHWNREPLAEAESKFAALLLEGAAAPIRLLIGVGELEQDHRIPMVANARQMYERMALLQDTCMHAEFRLFEDDNHVSLLPALISRAIRFALAPEPGGLMR
ncbi:alpha/beta hydrolase [Cohnella sp. 56]|uniref:alpha/beta hydrolase n=1 Tax=Cohnella sp. 56 TaxID=3113722 RepID=UPI0030EAE162